MLNSKHKMSLNVHVGNIHSTCTYHSIISDKPTHWVAVSNSLDLLIVLAFSKSHQSIRVQLATGGVELFSVIHCQFRTKGVDGYDEGSSISLKLQYVTHHISCCAAKCLTKLVEILQVSLQL